MGSNEVCVWLKTPNSRINGAVSPAARATARITPVTIPARASGRTTPVMVRQRLTPSASAASRRLIGTRAMTSWLARVTSGSMMIASAIEAA